MFKPYVVGIILVLACILAREASAQFSVSGSSYSGSQEISASTEHKGVVIKLVLRTSIFSPAYSKVQTLSSTIASRSDKIQKQKDPEEVRRYVQRAYPNASPAQKSEIANLMIAVGDELHKTARAFKTAPTGPVLVGQAILRQDILEAQLQFEVAAFEAKNGVAMQKAIGSFRGDVRSMMIEGRKH